MPESVVPATAAAVEAPAVETPETPAVAPVEKPKLNSAQYAALRRSQKEAKRLAAQGQQWAQERTQYESRLQTLERTAREAQAALEAAKADPIGWAKKSGVDPNGAIQKFLADGTPEQAILEAREEAKAARKELADYIAKQDREREEAQKRTGEQQVQALIQNGVNLIKANRKEWPYTNTVLTESEIRAKLAEIHRIGVERQEGYSVESIRNAFERFAKARWEKLQESSKELLTESPTDGQVTGGSPTARAGSIRSSAAATQPPQKNSIPPAPKRKAPLTPKEQREADLAALRAAMAADKKKREATKPPINKPAPRPSPSRAIRH